MTYAEKKAKLLRWLQTAIELELSTIPPYLVALLSIKPFSNRAAAEAIRSVMMEEMLHMVLVSNVISSLGGTVRLSKDNMPSFPLKLNFEGKTFADRKFDVDLAPFSAATIDTFMKIEQPRVAKPPAVLAMNQVDIPAPTIGEFYEGIVKQLSALAADPNNKTFVGDPHRQIGVDYYWSGGGKPVVVTDLVSAKAALEIVIKQGEGAAKSVDDGDAANFGQPFEVAHYFRFREIHFGKRYLPADDPSGRPSGSAIAVDYSAVYPIKTNASGADYASGSALANLNDSFNQNYTEMMVQLEQALNGQPKVLYTAIMNGMHGLPPLAIEMMQTPIDGDAKGKNGSPTFEWVQDM